MTFAEMKRRLDWVPRRAGARTMGNVTIKLRGPCSRRLAHQPNRRVLGTVVENGVEWTLHATKGLRRKRVA